MSKFKILLDSDTKSFSVVPESAKMYSDYYDPDYIRARWFPKGYLVEARPDGVFMVSSIDGSRIYKGKLIKTALKKAWIDCYNWHIKFGAPSSYDPRMPKEAMDYLKISNFKDLLK